VEERQASPHTIGAYRDTYRQLLKFVQQRLHKSPSQLNLEDIDAPLSSRSWTKLRRTTALAFASEICASRRFIPSFSTPLTKHQTIPPRSNGCLPSPASASPVR
jgi:site-specific recombinase XerC